MPFNEAQALLGIESLHPHDARAREERKAGEEKGPVVIQRPGIQHHAAPGDTDEIDEPLKVFVQRALPVIDDELRQAR